MSSKLVKKLLQQTAIPQTRQDSSSQQKAHKSDVQSAANVAPSKEELLQAHVQSVLRLDSLVQRYASSTAKSAFDRRSASLKRQQKRQRSARRQPPGGVGNSRGSSSSFAQRPREETFDKKKAKRRKEEGYFEEVAKALKKARKSKKKS